MRRAYSGALRLLICLILGAAALVGIQASPASATSCLASDENYPTTGQIQETNYPSSTRYYVTFQFSLNADQLCSLQLNGAYLAIKLEITGFNLPAEWSGYSITNSNLPGGIHAVDFENSASATNPTITRIYTSELQAGTTYTFTMDWDATVASGQTPAIRFVWAPAHWALPYDSEQPSHPVNLQFADWPSCILGRNTLIPGAYSNHNEAWCIFNNNPDATIMFGANSFGGGEPDGWLILGNFTWLTWSPTIDDELASYTSAPSGSPANQDPVNYSADRTIIQDPNGGLWVIVGGAKMQFGSMSEFTSLGYSTSGMASLDQATVDAIPTMPQNGTIVRSASGAIYIIAGGAKFPFGSMSEYYGLGYVNNQWINVPEAPLDAIPTAPSGLIANGTIIKDPTGRVFIVDGGVKFQFGSMTELTSLGYSSSQIVGVPEAPADAIPDASTASPPVDGTVLRSGGGQVYVIGGGAKFVFGSMAEYYGQGYSDNDYVNVPQAPLDAISDAPGNMPRNGTAVLRPDGSVFCHRRRRQVVFRHHV